jgi:chitodextrinase
MKPFLKIFIMLMSVSSVIGLHAQAPVPIAQYSFTGNANDQSSNMNNASVNGALLTQDRFGISKRAMLFDGVQSTITARNLPALNTANITVSFWVKVNKLPTSGEVFLLSHGGWQERWKISLPDHGRPVFTTNSTGGIKDTQTDSVTLKPGQWTYLTMVHDGTNDIIYINGVEKNKKAASGNLNNTTKDFGIGYSPIDNAFNFNGALDEVMLFGTALTSAEIQALYNAQNTAPTFAQGRVASYSFNGSGFDSSTYANHGVLSNVTSVTDRFGYGNAAYQFNGRNSSITSANSAQLNSANTTVSFWVNVKARPVSGEAYILSDGGWQNRWKISLPDHGKPVWSTKANGTNTDTDAGEALPFGVWKHVVMTHDGVSDKVYIDGVKKTEKAATGPLGSTTNPLGMGYDPIEKSSGSYFNGSLDEVQIYNYALTDADVTALYTSQSKFPGVVSDLVADYALDGNGWDASQFVNHATGVVNPTSNRFGYGAHALSFSGNDSLIASNSIALQSDNATIAFWVKPDQLPASGEVYLLSNGGWQERWKISLPDHGKVVFTTKTAAGVKDFDSDSVRLTVGQWKHVTMVHDAAGNKIFINGLLKKTNTDAETKGALLKTNKPFGIAYNAVEGGGNFKGSLDDIKIFNRALSDAEVLALYGTQNTAPVFSGTLVANYPFSNSGTDITPYANTADMSTALPTKDRFNKSNKAYAFNKSTATASNSPQLNSPLTSISFWAKVNQLPASGEDYMLSDGGYQERWKISLPDHGKPVFSTKTANGNVDLDADSVRLAIGQWTHIVMTHDALNDNIYINGLLKKSKSAPGDLLKTTHPLGIGYDPIDNAGYFNGSLDEVEIFNVALSAPEVLALYKAQKVSDVVGDTIAPSAPLDLVGTPVFTNVNLSWSASTDNVAVIGYNVYQNNSIIASIPGTGTAIANLTPRTKYNFGVSAIDAAGNESLITTIQVTSGEEQSKDTIAPTIPTNFTAQVGSNSVQLSWTASTDNRVVIGYVVLQDGKIIDTILAPITAKFVNGLKTLTAYTFEVYAYDAAGNKSGKAENTVTTLSEVNTGEPGLVASYPFDDNANDATPYANNGVIGGNPTFIVHTGFGGKAIKFDGDRDSVFVKNAVQLISDYTTLGFWIRVDSSKLSDAEAYVIDFGHWSQRWKVSLPQHLRIVFTTASKNTQIPNDIKDMDSGDGNELVKGTWWYVTMVHDGTNNIIYVNGIETKRVPAPGTLNNTARPLVFGNNPIEGGQYFVGALDNVKIYNKALTAAEVKKLFTSGTTPTEDQSAALLTMVKGIYPNPAINILTVKHSFSSKEDVLIRVLDPLGRQVDAIHFAKNSMPSGYFNLNISKYAQGTYFMNFVQDGKSLGSMKFIKQ